jgi:NAD-dependent deacetylase
LGDVAEVVRGARRLVVLTGAGISVGSGLPTYRGPGGLWDDETLRATRADGLPGSLPTLWSVMGPLRGRVLAARPNPAHFALSALERVGITGSVTVLTQNVDGLHQRAGSSAVVELHGNLLRSACLDCGTAFADDQVPDGHPDTIPRSPVCGGVARPDVVLFGEPLPVGAERAARDACRAADVLVVAGTSGAVTSATSMLSYAHDYGARCVLLNAEPWEPDCPLFDAAAYGPAEMLLPDLVRMLAGPGTGTPARSTALR